MMDSEKTVTDIVHRMSTEAQYTTDRTIRDYADVSTVIVDYRDKHLWEVKVDCDDSVSLPSDFYMTRDELTYQDALMEAQNLLEDDLRTLIDNGNDPMDAVGILDGRYEVRLSERCRKAIDVIIGARDDEPKTLRYNTEV